MGPCRASKSRTVELVSAAGETPNFNLPAFELSLANAANPLIIERIPFPESISRTQDRQPIVEFNMSNHSTKTTLLTAVKTNNRDTG
jgi:hypothetical protein